VKALYIDTPLDPPGGGQISLLTLLAALPAAIEKTVFLASGGSFLSELSARGISGRVVAAGELYREMASLAPDLVHCNSGTTRYAFRAALAARRLGLPFVWHNRVTESAGWKERLLAALSGRIVAISKAVENKFPYCRGKVRVVPNGVDTGLFSPGPGSAELRAGLGLAPGPVAGVFSRFEAGKGHELFLEAAALLPDKVSFLLPGDGPLLAALRARAAALPSAGRLVFPGFRRDMPELLRLCDIVVCPSTIAEGFGRVLIEAMACGKPVVATALGGPLEIIENGRDGLLSEPAPAALAGAIASLLPGGGRDAAAMGAAGRAKAVNRFSSGISAQKVADIYGELLGAGA
jgi:glycosyltransferase involved in cell wall biosynthesis